ncbi:titin homolog [Musca domestica]|uniref:Titin homolog n=1 Tax=Musca domestica TaxID=7370 RepID=A0A1I8NEL5_MUSDO|nr:titin homolog [Musca domestica]XP_011295520.1 titin homolog [Musca domestica]XP_011295521.1 titin homolog [Musca domestica]XP_058980400.1 titin homolog [Musca domestica]
MGNQQGKLQHQTQSGRPKKAVHWKSAERPSPPGRPILIPISDQQPDVVCLRWERPRLDGGSPITGYIVEHRRMGSPHWVKSTPVPVSNCDVAISGMEPGWRYQFRVFAENVVGRSDPSELSDILTVTLQRNAISVPRFVDELQDMHAVEDERVEFRVKFIGQPPPEISWFKDGYEIFSSRRTKIVNDNDASVLIIHQVALTDEGEIKCTATNRAGHVATRAKLFVQAPPKIRLPRTYEDGLIVEAEEVLRLKVGIAGQPLPQITWMHEGEMVQNGGRFEITNTDKNSMLKIENVHRDDRGEYSVKASNRLGEDVASFLVTVTARPNPPGKVRLNMSFGKSATLSWTAPVDDGGCKIGNYIVEYFRIGWNVWLKAVTTRSLSTTLHDLIEGSEYKFRVKAENPYGVSEPSEESEILFLPDPKRGITKPTSQIQINEDKPVPPRRKTLSPQRPTADAATETLGHFSPKTGRKLKPQVFDSEDLHREMSYGTSVRKSPSPFTAKDSVNNNKPTTGNAPNNLTLNIEAAIERESRSPERSPKTQKKSIFLPGILKAKETPTSATTPAPKTAPVAENSKIMDFMKPRNRSLSPPPDSAKTSKNGNTAATTTALQRSSEPVKLGSSQNATRFTGLQALSPAARNAPALAIAIATSSLSKENDVKAVGNGVPKSAANNGTNGRAALPNPTIEISAPPKLIVTTAAPSPPTTPKTVTVTSASMATATPTENSQTMASQNPTRKLSNADKHDEVHTSNEFMLVVFDKNSKVKDKDKQDSFELDLEDAIQPPPISISAPDLALLEYTSTLHTFPIRRSVSSTELLYERAMARFYEAVELEEAEKARKLKISQDKIAAPTNVRKRLGSMTEAERLSFEKRSEMRRQSADIAHDIKSSALHKWNSKENISDMKPLSRTMPQMYQKRQESQESGEVSEDYQTRSELNRDDSYDLGSDYTESTASSDVDSIEKFKMELMARTHSPSPRELETYHPRNMSAGVFTPYRAPTPDEAALVLTRPVPLPSPDFVPKPILKRPSYENVLQANTTNTVVEPATSTASNVKPETAPSDKLDIAKGIKSFFKRDKRSATERNTEENEMISNPQEKTNASLLRAEAEAKRKAKEEEEERKRKEAERLMMEEAHAAVDHYSELVQQVSTTRKYHTPLYMDQDELKKISDKAKLDGTADEDGNDALQQRRSHSPDMALIPPVSNKPRLSISERGQLMHVRDTASDMSVKHDTFKPEPEPETPSEHNAPLTFSPSNSLPATPSEPLLPVSVPQSSPAVPTPPMEDEEVITTTVISETVEERPDSRGRPRLVKVKRIIKKRMPSGTRSRDTSLSRPPSSASHDFPQARTLSRTRRSATAESRSPGPFGRSPLTLSALNNHFENQNSKALQLPSTSSSHESLEVVPRPSTPLSDEEAHEKVRSAISYSTDMVLFLVACYIYLFKDARLVLPILALMIYRQLGEAISKCIPSWLKRKKE